MIAEFSHQRTGLPPLSTHHVTVHTQYGLCMPGLIPLCVSSPVLLSPLSTRSTSATPPIQPLRPFFLCVLSHTPHQPLHLHTVHRTRHFCSPPLFSHVRTRVPTPTQMISSDVGVSLHKPLTLTAFHTHMCPGKSMCPRFPRHLLPKRTDTSEYLSHQSKCVTPEALLSRIMH